MRRGPTKRHTNHNLGNAPCALCRFKHAKAEARHRRWWKRHLNAARAAQQTGDKP